jgi:PhnB protein
MADALSGRLDRLVDTLLARGDATAALTDAELAPLARLAADLRHYPNPSFAARLRATLKERTTMTTMTTTLATAAPTTTRAREGFTTVTAYVAAKDSMFTEFVKQAFGAVETETTTGPRGVHRELRIGSSMMMVGETREEGGVPVRPAAYHLYVEDVDGTYARALAAGATTLGEIGKPTDRPYGERSAFVQDAMGNHWYIGRPLSGPAVPEGHGTVTPYLLPSKAPEYVDFLKRAFGAVETARHLGPEGRIMHAQLRIGNAMVELGEPEPSAAMTTTFYLYVDDADALYERAVAAGATSLAPPTDQWYGDRVASVEDYTGTRWYIARPAL